MKTRLNEAFAPVHLEIVDDSARHAGHAGARGGGGHFIVTVVSASFDGCSLVEQHRMVNAALKDMIGGSVHALGLHTIPAAEWTGGAENR